MTPVRHGGVLGSRPGQQRTVGPGRLDGSGGRSDGSGRRLDLRLALLVAIALLAGACTAIPSDGPVIEVRPVDPAYPVPFVDVTAPPPSAGDEEADIAEGFLLAMSAYEPGYAVARLYLTPEAADRWRPERGVAIYAAVGTGTTAVGRGSVSLDLPLRAHVRPDGQYERAPEADRLTLDLQMEQVEGEWRISNPPEGILMTDFDFDREFQQFNRYFFDPPFEVLVPDEIWLPRSGRLPTLLTAAVLSGPSQWLAPAVRTAAPAGTGLAIRSVPVELGTARVDLTEAVAAASPAQRDRLAAQLSRTLGQLPEVRSVAFSAEGVPLVLPGAQSGVRPAVADPRFEPVNAVSEDRVFAVSNGVPFVLDEELRRVPGPLGGNLMIRSIAASYDGTRIAGVTSAGTELVLAQARTGAVPRTVVRGTDLVSPAFDRFGLLWVVDRRPGDEIVSAVAVDGARVTVRTPGLADHRVRSLRVSADGTRMALVTEEGGAGRLQLAVVLRDGGAAHVAGLRTVHVGLADVRDVAWYAPDALALLGSPVLGGPYQPYVVDLSGGQVDSRGPVIDGVSIAATQHQPLVVSTGEGRLLRQDAASRWREVGRGRSPAYPG